MREPEPGDVYLLGHDNYRFGLGDLRVHVTQVLRPVRFGEQGTVSAWWHVRALCRPPGDAHLWPGDQREIYLRDAALQHAETVAARSRSRPQAPGPSGRYSAPQRGIPGT